MGEQSQKEEMNAAIRAHRARHNVPRSIAPEPVPAAAAPPEPEPVRPKNLLTRLFGK
jgi:hypothetical protein